jgi:hypothetical protein
MWLEAIGMGTSTGSLGHVAIDLVIYFLPTSFRRPVFQCDKAMGNYITRKTRVNGRFGRVEIFEKQRTYSTRSDSRSLAL